MDTTKKNKKSRLAIVLLSYNSLPIVKILFPKIVNSIPKNQGIEIYFVDNASIDYTGNYIRENFPNVKLITITKNMGFTGGYVEALSLIEAENYVLISSDIDVSSNWILPCLELLESDVEIAVVQPKIKSYDKRNEFEYAGASGGFIDFLGFPFCRGRIIEAIEKDIKQYNDVREIFWASGACMFIKADLYHKVGGLDIDFFAHMEEIDLAWRLKRARYKVMVQPQSEVFHVGGSVIKYGSPQKIFQNHRNNLIMLIKNLPLHQLYWKFPFRICLDYIAFFNMLMIGEFRGAISVIKAHQNIFFHFLFWCKKRNQIKQNIPFRTKLIGIYKKSIIWDFFIRNKKKFSDLDF